MNLFLNFLGLLCLLTLSEGAKLVYKIEEDGSYTFTAGGNQNFHISSGDVFLQSNKQFYSTADKTLKLTGQKSVHGSDVTGVYEGKLFHYVAGTTRMQSQILIYNGGEFVRFTQSFPDGVVNSNVSSHDDSLSGFPSFKIGGQVGTKSAGYISMFDNMCGYSYGIANVSSAGQSIRTGQRAGPLVLFDHMNNVMVFSAFSSFMAHNTVYNSKTNQLHFGIMGGVTRVPVDYQIDTILYYGSEGINRGIESWGEVLTRRYRKSRSRMKNDFLVKYLGYWTDNGAFYYYNTEKNKTYERTILDVLNYAKTYGIPYRYVQYDSWWYFKGDSDGVKNWTAMSSVFPNGSESLFQQHGLPVGAHNRYWASDTDYARQNGGSYNFYVETHKSIPHDERFWSDLMRNSSKWGLIMYEQDWLDREFELMTITHTDINLGRDWLLQMGHAAEDHDITIQYCMALSRHMLQSVEIPSVTQARVSGDYQPGNDQWKIGITSMFAHAIHLAPFKDTFWTTSHQQDSPYSSDEKYPALQTLMATLSTGPVGPSDKIGYTNTALLLRCCRSDGLILKPSRPITTADERMVSFTLPSLMQVGLNDDAEVFSTYTNLWYSSMPMTHGIALVTDLSSANYKIKPSTMYMSGMDQNTSFVAYHGYPGDDPKLYTFSESHPLPVPKCGRADFQLWYASPIIKLSNGTKIAILGERNKWVPVSKQRIRHVEHKGDNLLVDIEGSAGEFVTFGFMVNNAVVFVNCNFPQSGTSRISLGARKCINI